MTGLLLALCTNALPPIRGRERESKALVRLCGIVQSFVQIACADEKGAERQSHRDAFAFRVGSGHG